MSDQIAIDSLGTTLEAIAPARPLKVRIARHISNILSPVTISGPAVIFVALYHAANLLVMLAYAGVTLFFLSVGPMAYIIVGVRLGKLSDIDVSRRADRVGPFLFSITSTTVGLFVLMYLHGPKNLETVMLSTGISAVILMVTTLWWKISIHASSLAGAATILTTLYGTVMLPTFLLLVLVSWSRVVLRRHTVAQVIAGSLVSIVLAILIIAFRGV